MKLRIPLFFFFFSTDRIDERGLFFSSFVYQKYFTLLPTWIPSTIIRDFVLGAKNKFYGLVAATK